MGYIMNAIWYDKIDVYPIENHQLKNRLTNSLNSNSLDQFFFVFGVILILTFRFKHSSINISTC